MDEDVKKMCDSLILGLSAHCARDIAWARFQGVICGFLMGVEEHKDFWEQILLIRGCRLPELLAEELVNALQSVTNEGLKDDWQRRRERANLLAAKATSNLSRDGLIDGGKEAYVCEVLESWFMGQEPLF
jgi:hypothetical protein